MSTTATSPASPAAARLSMLDRWLPAWIGLAMVAGILLGRFVPGLSTVLSHLEVGGISVPIALGLLVMMGGVRLLLHHAVRGVGDVWVAVVLAGEGADRGAVRAGVELRADCWGAG